MNEKPSPSRWDDAQAAPEALGALLARFPAYAFESECQRSLDMIVLCQRYISRLVEEQNGGSRSATVPWPPTGWTGTWAA